MYKGASRCHNVGFQSYYLPIFVQGALRYICSMFRMYLNLNYLWTYSSRLPVYRRPVDVQISTKCIYDVSPHPCEHVGYLNSFLRHSWAEKLTYKWTKLFAYFGTFDLKNLCFYLRGFIVKVGEMLRFILLCKTQLGVDVHEIWTYLHVHQG